MQQLMNTYSRRFLVNPPYIDTLPNPTLSLIVVIPSYKEPDIVSTLSSLSACFPPKGIVEIIVTINAPEGSDSETLSINQRTVEQVENWKEKHLPFFMELVVIREENLAVKFAGAGWARKIGMDEALRRWSMLEKDGTILCLDADCTVSQNYLIAAETAFKNSKLTLGHFEFRHQWNVEPNILLKRGIIAYELHLRCHILGLDAAGYPFAVHTVGSCMAVRASVYAKAGGMNRRKAGEDFYFMHKVLPLGGFGYIQATVFPSSRVSDRVPFGTGRAQWEWINTGEERTTYSTTVYEVLRSFFEQICSWYSHDVSWDKMNPTAVSFLQKHGLEERIHKMKQQSTTQAVFLRRFWQWMDGFMVLKFVHYLRDNGFQNESVLTVAVELNRQINDPKIEELIHALQNNCGN